MNNPPSYYTHTYSPYDRYPIPTAYYPAYWAWHRDFPPVDTKILVHSITSFQRLVEDASLVLKKLAEPFIAQQIMTAAQTGNQKEVDRIVHSFGCESVVSTSYTPSSVQFTISPHMQGMPCCNLSMSIKWGK